jgi:hypothetical protein
MIFGIRAHGHAARIWRQGAMRSRGCAAGLFDAGSVLGHREEKGE